VRGDEVVSLGWCFWHRGCFGCLICGMSMSVPRQNDEDKDNMVPTTPVNTVEATGEWGAWKYGGRKRRRCVGVELEEIPLCSVCSVETAGDSHKQILEKGLESVSRSDGGLSRDRLHMLSEDGDDFKIVSRNRLQRPGNPRASLSLSLDISEKAQKRPVIMFRQFPLVEIVLTSEIAGDTGWRRPNPFTPRCCSDGNCGR
jgi:hypothetical protein